MSKQNWTVGATVDVGFVKNLTIVEAYNDGSFVLTASSGVRYTFGGNGLCKGLVRWS